MKKDDKVVIRDSSYSMVVTEHGLKSGYGAPHNVRKEQGTIIEVGCKFPDPHYYQTQVHTCNDTVVRTDSGKVVFIEEHFLKLVEPTHKVMIEIRHNGGMMSGQIVEISDKLYKEIKRDSQTK